MLRIVFIILIIANLAKAQVFPTDIDLVPWPWSVAKSFPWTQIRGVWKTVGESPEQYFVLRVIKSPQSGIKQLQVKQIDSETCKVVGSGVGVEVNRSVVAQMNDGYGPYKVIFTAFDEEDSPKPAIGLRNVNAVLVASIGPVIDYDDNQKHIQIGKVSDRLEHHGCRLGLDKSQNN